MVAARVARRFIIQQLVKRGKPAFVKHVSQEYGQIAGSIAGIALSVSVGDYYGAFTGISGKWGNNPPDSRNPPFGYFPGGEDVIGPPNGQFRETLRPGKSYSRIRRGNRRYNNCVCQGNSRRSRRGKSRMQYICT